MTTKAQKNLMHFWDKNNSLSFTSILVGLIAVVLVVILLVFMSSQRVVYAKQFYKLAFKVNFLEDLKPGTKVRYQGAIIIGEVEKVTSKNNVHLLIAKIKKDFVLPKKDIKVSVKTWGFFGAKFVNVAIFNPSTDGENYNENDIVEVDKVMDSSAMFRLMTDYFHKKDSNTTNLLEKKLKSFQEISKSLRSNKFLDRRVIRKSVKSFVENLLEKMKIFHDIGEKGYEELNEISKSTDKKIKNFKADLPKLKKSLANLSSIINYSKSKARKRIHAILHDETTFYLWNEYMVLTKEKLKEIRQDPYRLIFRKN